MPLTRDEDIRELLENARTIAVVGASDRPDRPSYGVMKTLQDHGYRTIPVNPQITGEHVHGEFVFRELAQLGDPIDIVDIFRRSEAAGEAVDEAIAIGAKAVWLQLGRHQSRRRRARRGRRAEGRDGPLSRDRHSAARRGPDRRLILSRNVSVPESFIGAHPSRV